MPSFGEEPISANLTGRPSTGLPRLRKHVLALVEARPFTRSIIALIVVNAVLLGLETFPAIMADHGALLIAIDQVILAIFVVEIGLRLFAHGGAFFRDPWSVFDFFVVAIALVPTSEAFSVLRAMRILRVLRLISAFPQLRRVVAGLLGAVPGLGAIAAILVIVLYVFAVMAAKLFGAQYPQWFGDLFSSLFTLFQIMTLEGWAIIAREIGQTHAYAWAFFIIYILIVTFTVLNLFIAVIVEAIQRIEKSEEQKSQAGFDALERKIDALSAKLDELARSSPRQAAMTERAGADESRP